MSKNNSKQGIYVAQEGVPEDDCGICTESLKDPKKSCI